MAIYGKDFYGLTKYGADLRVDLSVEPFEALPFGYETIRLSWTNPAGNWSRLRLLKSRNGYAVNENDGQILLDIASGASTYADDDLSGGSFYYYTIFLKTPTGWFRVGTTSQLAVSRRQYVDWLWERMPRYFHYIPKFPDGTLKEYFTSAEVYDPDRLDQINQGLRQFLSVLGWGLDFLRDYLQTSLWTNNPRLTHMENLERLAETLGTSIEYEVPASVNRAKVANAALLARRRGSVLGLEDQVLLSTGYDLALQVTNNLFLSQDQATFTNPQIDQWDPARVYPTTVNGNPVYVQWVGRVFRCILTASGSAKAPPSSATSNTWWQFVSNSALTTNPINGVSVADPDTGGVFGWKAWRGTTADSTTIGAFVSSPFDSTVTTSNSLYVKNTSGSGAAMDVWGAANETATYPNTPGPVPINVIKQGLPIPRLLEWDETVTYTSGMLVVHKCRAWRALRDSVGRNPIDFTNDWEQVGWDERPKLAFSFYSHADFDSSAGVAVTPGGAFYDERGNLIKDITAASWSSFAFFDTFNGKQNTRLVDRTPDDTMLSETWAKRTGTDFLLVEASKSERVVTNTGTGITTVAMGAAPTKYKIAVTFKRPALQGRTECLVLRYASATDYVRVTRTGVDQIVAGVLTSKAVFATPIKDNDRLTIWMDETVNTQTYYVNGVQTTTTSGLPQPTGGVGGPRYNHGLAVL